MNARESVLGMQTAWRRFLEQRDGAAVAGSFENRLRELELHAESLNLTPDSVHLAAEIAALEPGLDQDQRIAMIVLIVISLATLQEGSTRFPVTGEISREPMGRMLGALCADSFGADAPRRLASEIEQMLTSGAARTVIGTAPGDYKPLLYVAPFIYHQRIHLSEGLLAQRLADFLSSAPPATGSLDRELDGVAAFIDVSGRRVELSAEQREAVGCAARSHLTLISGGPGTGKTSIVLAIIRLLMRAGVTLDDIALAAPTGKAAYRIRESIRAGLEMLAERDARDEQVRTSCPEPSTIHRLLGYAPARGTFRHHRNNPLSASVVIVDEGSMLDLTLMQRLLEAVRPDARLIILGDSDQLPSVAAGAVFRDLAGPAPCGRSQALSKVSVRLTHSYRTAADAAGGAIAALAGAVNRGDAGVLDSGASLVRRNSAEQIAFSGAELLAPAGRVAGAFLDRWYSERIAGDELLEELIGHVYELSDSGFAEDDRKRLERLLSFRAASRLLCVTRVMDTGADRINAYLHRKAAHDAGVPERKRFIAGEAVLVLRNDYERMLFNGDQGIVLTVRGPGGGRDAMAVFPHRGGFAAFRLDSLEEQLDHCYAMTVHKAQGSEFDSVGFVLPERDLPMLTRELIYTAVSRARRSVVIAGSEDLLRGGISRRIERYSGLSERVGALAASGK